MKSTTMKRKKHLTSDLKELQFLSFSFICLFGGGYFLLSVAVKLAWARILRNHQQMADGHCVRVL